MYRLVKSIIVWLRSQVMSSARKTDRASHHKWDITIMSFEVDRYMETPKEVTVVRLQGISKHDKE